MTAADPPRLHLGLPEHLREAAAQLYWQAFGGKLGGVLGPESRALPYLRDVIRADHAIVALDGQGGLLGIAGFRSPDGSFAGGGPGDLRRHYGLWGLIWRGGLLRLLVRDIDNDRFLIDGLAVQPRARGRGIGSALVAALCREARARGYGHVRLEVVDTNWRARALYERLGFLALRADGIGPLRHIFGFRAAVVMVRPV